MTKYVLAGCFGSGDAEAYGLVEAKDEQLKFLDFLVGEKSLRFGIGSAISQLSKLNIYPSEIALDLLMLAIMVQAADTRLNRIQTSQDAWTREISKQLVKLLNWVWQIWSNRPLKQLLL